MSKTFYKKIIDDIKIEKVVEFKNTKNKLLNAFFKFNINYKNDLENKI